mgnify:CR=1 FL=1
MTEMLEQQSTAFAVCVLFGSGIGLIIGLFNAFKKVINIKGAWIGFIGVKFPEFACTCKAGRGKPWIGVKRCRKDTERIKKIFF